jgi:hypothetical protein
MAGKEQVPVVSSSMAKYKVRHTVLSSSTFFFLFYLYTSMLYLVSGACEMPRMFSCRNN